MTKDEYRVALHSAAWKKRRQEILNRDGYTCQVCNLRDTDGHEIHHIAYAPGGNPEDAADWCLLTVCPPCHKELHKAAGAGFGELIANLIHMKEKRFYSEGVRRG